MMYDMRDAISSLFVRQTTGGGGGGACPAPGADPRSPPQGQCLVTYTCPGNLYPNVCGNAKSAIQDRGKTSILTHMAGSKTHDTIGWYSGHYIWKSREPQPMSGWKLDTCEVEEYPFGSGDPNPRGSSRQWDRFPVMRLIPGGGGENQQAGNHLRNWLTGIAAQNNLPGSNGIVYCVDFDPSFTNYLPEDTVNYCADPYGPEFTLVNGLAVAGGGGDDSNFNKRWDPWFNQLVGRRNYQFIKTVNGQAIYANIPPQYCRYPSPGRMRRISNPGAGQGNFQLDPNYQEEMRFDSVPANRRCEDIPGANTKRDVNATDLVLFNGTRRTHARDVFRRQTSGGSFLDPRIFKFMGCSGDTGALETDPCSIDPDSCGINEVPTGPDGFDPLPGPEVDPGISTGPAPTGTNTADAPSTTTTPGNECFVPSGCRNVAEPDGCAVLCDEPTTTSDNQPTTTADCFVPGGCRNVAEPTGCAVLCDEPTTTTTSRLPVPTSTDIDPDSPNFETACFSENDGTHRRFIFDDYVAVTGKNALGRFSYITADNPNNCLL